MIMTEKEKMLKGKLYKAFAEELLKERQFAREMVYIFNTLHPSETEEKNKIIVKLFGKIGSNFFIEPPFRCDYGYNISAGDNLYINYNCTILDCAKVIIGNNVLIAPNVSLITAGHPIDYESRNEGNEFALPISIGDNVWIGCGVIVNPGVRIGNNTIIGSGSVVTRDIPSNSIAFGNPCKVYREI